MSELMTKHEMTEEDIKLQYITPAIESGKEKAHRLSALLQAQYSFGYRRGKG